jgi:hypothetical protein
MCLSVGMMVAEEMIVDGIEMLMVDDEMIG